MEIFLEFFRAIDLNIFSIMFIITFFSLLFKFFDHESKMFANLLKSTIFIVIQLFAEILVEGMVRYNVENRNIIIFFINSYLYFSSSLITRYLILVISLAINPSKNPKKLETILNYILVVYITLVLTNLFTPILFRIPTNGIPIFGPLYYVGHGFVGVEIAIMLFLIIKNKKTLSKTEKWIFASFTIMPIIGMTIQVFVPKTFLMWSFVATTVVMMYIFLQKKITQQDLLTKLWTRTTFDIYLENTLDLDKNNKKDAFMIFMDLDEFKPINDIYGHREGDKALRKFADTLKKTLNRSAKIARYGGDEFVALYYNIPNIDLEKEIKNLKEAIKKENKSKKNKWTIKFSYAYDKYDSKTYGSFGQFIRYLDKKMYKQKRK